MFLFYSWVTILLMSTPISFYSFDMVYGVKFKCDRKKKCEDVCFYSTVGLL